MKMKMKKKSEVSMVMIRLDRKEGKMSLVWNTGRESVCEKWEWKFEEETF